MRERERSVSGFAFGNEIDLDGKTGDGTRLKEFLLLLLLLSLDDRRCWSSGRKRWEADERVLIDESSRRTEEQDRRRSPVEKVEEEVQRGSAKRKCKVEVQVEVKEALSFFLGTRRLREPSVAGRNGCAKREKA